MTPSPHGPEIHPDRTVFRAWAPRVTGLSVRVRGEDHPMRDAGGGSWSAEVHGARDGDDYQLVLPDGRALPDPATRRQPAGVHGPSRLFDPGRHAWRHQGFRGLPLEGLVFYELHVGTFTSEGTLDAAAARLPELAELGVTCVELMPVQPFPGERNWGYDGVAPWAVHEAYGGPAALQRLVDRAHGLGLAVALDVVYNHLGPEGNHLAPLAPYFTDRHKTPWGDGLDWDGPGAPAVRAWAVGAAVQWVRDFRVDVLRLDATHAIEDGSRRHVIAELREAVAEEGRRAGRLVHVVAEDDRNDRAVLDPPPSGWGCSAVWADDLHHALHALVTGERGRYLADFGAPADVARALSEGFVYQGQRSRYRGRAHGTSPRGLAPARFVTCAQNHDQVGNRPHGERLATLVPWEALAPIAGLVLLGSGTPLLFMGEEYGETRPFLYFTSHGDPALARAVTEGRRTEHLSAAGGPPPDPQDPETFLRSKLTHRRDGRHGAHRALVRGLLAARARHLEEIAAGWPEVVADGTALALRRRGLEVRANLSATPAGGLGPWALELREA
jgi:maltooligosyltrehalose trehalohydrolase